MRQVAPILLILAAIVVAVFAYGRYNYSKGQRDMLVEIEIKRAKSVQEIRRIENEISVLSDEELRRRAAQWVQRSR